MLIDTHCHFEKQYYDNFDEVINNAANNNVKILIACGCSKSANIEALDVANKHSNVYSTIGYHPDQADLVSDQDIIELEEQLKNKKVIVDDEKYYKLSKENKIIFLHQKTTYKYWN